MSEKHNSVIAVIGIDIGKNSFHVVGLDGRGAIALRQKWSRGQLEMRLANMPACLIGMEACVGALHLNRRLSTSRVPKHVSGGIDDSAFWERICAEASPQRLNGNTATLPQDQTRGPARTELACSGPPSSNAIFFPGPRVYYPWAKYNR